MRFISHGSRGLALAVAFLLAGWQSADAQTMFRMGASVQPVFEGWEPNPDGTYTMWFGYMNRNYEEEPHVQVGEANSFSPGPADRGQPTHFYTRRQLFTFSVVVPADWGDQSLVWTLRHDGEDHTAVGRLGAANWGVDEGVWRANRSPGGIRGRGDQIEVTNEPPTVEIRGPSSMRGVVGEAITLTAWASDDGEPGPVAPRAPRPQQDDEQEELPIVNFVPIRSGGPSTQNLVQFATAAPTGLAVTWVHHRGPGRATFSPQAEGLEPGNVVSTSVVFSEPGTHVVRAAADDGAFYRYANVTVEVAPR